MTGNGGKGEVIAGVQQAATCSPRRAASPSAGSDSSQHQRRRCSRSPAAGEEEQKGPRHDAGEATAEAPQSPVLPQTVAEVAPPAADARQSRSPAATAIPAGENNSEAAAPGGSAPDAADETSAPKAAAPAEDDPLEVFHRSRPAVNLDRTSRSPRPSSRRTLPPPPPEPPAGGRSQVDGPRHRPRSDSRGGRGPRRPGRPSQTNYGGNRRERDDSRGDARGGSGRGEYRRRSSPQRRKNSRSASPLGLFPEDDGRRRDGGRSRDEGWAKDNRGRPFRVPHKPSEAELARAASMDRRIADFVGQNRLDGKVSRIMANMHPDDVEQVLDEGIDTDRCRNPTAVVVSRIRKIERAAGRPNALRHYDRRPPNHGAPRDSRSRSRSRYGRRAPRRGRVDSRGRR